MTGLELREKLETRETYADFDVSNRKLNLKGWGGNTPLFSKLVEETRPETVIEVGSWLGQSSATIGKALQAMGGGRQLVCVDTWLGALDHWDRHNDEWYRALGRKNGYPTLYYDFLANMVLSGLQETVVPFPVTSLIAARYFKVLGLQAQLIYIDASHDYDDVVADIRAYVPLLALGGVLFGDDYDTNGVKLAVSHTLDQSQWRVSPEDRDGKWVARRK
jgi:Methyltransferase domain